MDPLRRRQSILKNDGEATPTKTFRNKRISFSGKNSVKEFIVNDDKHTVWGTSYEKEMEANVKAGDSTAPSHLDISGVSSIMCETVNKENMVPNPPRISFALLDNEVNAQDNEDRTILHALPHENISTDKDYAELFQLKSFLEAKRNVDASACLKESAMEVSMMWQDIMSQTKEAGPSHKILAMGNNMDIPATSLDADISTFISRRQTIYDGQMDISRSVIISRIPSDENETSKEPSLRQTVYYDPTNGNTDQSVATTTFSETIDTAPSNKVETRSARQTVIFSGKNDVCVMELSRKRDHQQTIHYSGGFDDISLGEALVEGHDKENVPLAPKRPNRETVHYSVRNADMEISRSEAMIDGRTNKRTTIYYAPEAEAMEESMRLATVALIHYQERERAASMGVMPRHRPTIHYQDYEAEMDETSYPQEYPVVSPKRSRQTMVFGDDDAKLEESLQTTNPSSPTAGFATTKEIIIPKPVDGDLEESIVHKRPTTHQEIQPPKLTKSRETTYFVLSDANMDESVQPALMPTINNRVHDKKPNRQSVYFSGNDGKINESTVQPRTSHEQSVHLVADNIHEDMSMVTPRHTRETIHFDPHGTGIDESKCPGSVGMSFKTARQTIYFNTTEWDMEESVRCAPNGEQTLSSFEHSNKFHHGIADEPIKQSECEIGQLKLSELSNSDYIGNYAAEQMEVVEGSQVPAEKRATKFIQSDDGTMGELAPGNSIPATISGNRLRQTVFEIRDMEESMNNSSPARQMCHSVYYKDQNNDLDISPHQSVNVTPALKIISRRCTVHFPPEEDGMEESLLEFYLDDDQARAQTTCENAIGHNASHHRRNHELTEQVGRQSKEMVPRGGVSALEQEIQMSPLEMSLHCKRNKSGVANRTVQEALEIAIFERSRRDTTVNNVENLVGEESVDLENPTLPTASKSIVITAPELSATRQRTFHVPPEASVLHGQTQISALKGTSNTAWDSVVSDLNNSEDSIELMDSQGRATRPISMASQRLSIASPLLQDETVNDLILNFNVTGQLVRPKELIEEDVAEHPKGAAASKNPSRIPVAKVSRTPIKILVTRLDLSTVDTVCRDAAPATMPKFKFGEEGNTMDEMTFVGGKKQLEDHRLSIPDFVEEELERMNQTKRQTMQEIQELLADSEEEDRCANIEVGNDFSSGAGKHLKSAAKIDLPDLGIWENVNFKEAKEFLKTIRFKMDKVMHASPVEQSLLLSKTAVEDKELKREITREIEEKTKQGIPEWTDKTDRGCFPLCLSMEDMIKNLLESEHKRWRYQDLYYFVGLLKFTHRLIKTFQVVIRFELGDPEFEKEHYLPFQRFQIIEQNLSGWSDLDQLMHKELMQQLPVGLVSRYGSSDELGRFLYDVDRICARIFRDSAL